MERKQGPKTHLDRDLMWRIIEMEMPRRRDVKNIQGLVEAAGVSRGTIYRMRDGDPNVGDNKYRSVEAALGFPPDTLRTAGMHDTAGLADISAPGHLIVWLSKELAKDQGQPGSAVGT